MAEIDGPRTIRFGLFEVNLRAGELRKNGVKIKLQRQPFRILVVLLQHRGEVVTREELRKELWSTDTFVDFEHSLNAAIKRLRDALRDSADNPIFIETLARRGYRFNAPIDKADAPSAPEIPASSVPAMSVFRRRPLALTGVALTMIAALAALNWTVVARWRTDASGTIESLAVLPLENLSRDPEQEYFSDGMTDALTSQLSKTGALRVVSVTSAMRYKGTRKSLPEIGRELHVDGLMEGSVMRSGNSVRIVLHLIRAQTDQHVWTETYERDLGDVLKLQKDVAQAVAQQIHAQLTPAQEARLRTAATVDPGAYEAYLRGRFYDLINTQTALKKAQAYFEEAVRKDRNFAPAYVGLGDSYLNLGTFRWLPPQDAYRYASEAIHEALQLDDSLAEAHSTLAYLKWRYAWDWQGAEREFRRAVDLNPTCFCSYEGHVWYLAWSGRRDEALAEVGEIRRLDPAYPFTPIQQAGVHYHQRDYRSLVQAGQESIAAYPNDWSGHYFLAVGYEGLGQPAQAVAEYQQAVGLSQHDSDTVAGLAHAYAATGRIAEAKKLLDELQRQSKASYVSPYMIAAIYLALGQKDKSVEFLEKAFQQRSPDLAYFLKADLRMDPLRSDRRFQDLLRRVGLPQ